MTRVDVCHPHMACETKLGPQILIYGLGWWKYFSLLGLCEGIVGRRSQFTFFQAYLVQVNESKGWCTAAPDSGTMQQTRLVGPSHLGTPGLRTSAYHGNTAGNALEPLLVWERTSYWHLPLMLFYCGRAQVSPGSNREAASYPPFSFQISFFGLDSDFLKDVKEEKSQTKQHLHHLHEVWDLKQTVKSILFTCLLTIQAHWRMFKLIKLPNWLKVLAWK